MKIYTYTIYQVRAKEDFAFMDWKRAKRFNWSFTPYKVEWVGIAKAKDDYELLDRLFVKFNINHPLGFTGHSMSVSDIVKVHIKGDEDKDRYYYCDVRGWKDITEEVEGK